ncbi:MAG: hypothetical protein ACLGPM_06350 [Acidobacteriota bacterium]
MSPSVANSAARNARRTVALLGSLLALVFIVFLVYAAFRPPPSGFDGVWLRASGETWMPEQMELRVRGNVMDETLPSASEYVSFHMIADGREHSWTDPDAQNDAPARVYTAQLTTDSFTLAIRSLEAGAGSAVHSERWLLLNGGRELAILNQDGQTLYRRASWLHRMLTHAP